MTTVCNWPEFQLVQNIKVFLRFANIYQQLIQGFSCIAATPISMLRTISKGLEGNLVIAGIRKVENSDDIGVEINRSKSV